MNSTPRVGLELATPSSRFAWSSDWGSQVPPGASGTDNSSPLSDGVFSFHALEKLIYLILLVSKAGDRRVGAIMKTTPNFKLNSFWKV